MRGGMYLGQRDPPLSALQRSRPRPRLSLDPTPPRRSELIATSMSRGRPRKRQARSGGGAENAIVVCAFGPREPPSVYADGREGGPVASAPAEALPPLRLPIAVRADAVRASGHTHEALARRPAASAASRSRRWGATSARPCPCSRGQRVAFRVTSRGSVGTSFANLTPPVAPRRRRWRMPSNIRGPSPRR
jgi:hypothetical protein